MSGSAVAERVTLDSDLVIETLAHMNAVDSLLSQLGNEEEEAFAEVSGWLSRAADTFERTAFDQVDVLRGDDDPVVVAVTSRSLELAAEVMEVYGGLPRAVAEGYRRNAEEVRENKTIAIDFS